MRKKGNRSRRGKEEGGEEEREGEWVKGKEMKREKDDFFCRTDCRSVLDV